MKSITLCSYRESLLRKFRAHLLSTQGLALRTCEARTFYVREFLQDQLHSPRGKLRLEELTPEDLLNYVLKRSAQDSSGRLQALASALRSFGRFLHYTGHSRHDWAAALPRIASPGRACLPDYLEANQLSRLLKSIDTTTAAGLRDWAILLCLARLGLRAAEVAALTLDQIRWRTGVIDLAAGKVRHERQLPLPQDTGQAIADYLRARKVRTHSRQVFCAIRNGQALSPAAISQVAKRALQRAGIQTPRPGAHLLRRTLASHLIQQGVSLKAIADLLGHRCLDTTRIYAHVNHSMLLEVAGRWPTEVSQ